MRTFVQHVLRNPQAGRLSFRRAYRERPQAALPRWALLSSRFWRPLTHTPRLQAGLWEYAAGDHGRGHRRHAAHDVPGKHVATGNIPSAIASILLKGNPAGTLRFKSDVQDRIAQILTDTNPATLEQGLAAVSRRAQTDDAFRASLNGYGIAPAKVAALQAAGQDTDPWVSDAPEPMEPEATVGFFARPPLYRPMN